ncbi:MAG TPA: chemotaxis protein CheA [Opitutaceae bacterium]
MPISAATLAALDDVSNRLAGESILARVGSDEGLIPAYSLISELLDLCAGLPALIAPLQAFHATLDARLNAAQPFDEATLGELRRLVGWLPGAIAAAASGAAMPAAEPISPVSPGSPPGEAFAPEHAPEAGAAADAEAVDAVLDLNLEENGELLAEFHAEALDHLLQIEAALLTLDAAPEDRDALNSLFRSFHTIKGVSGFLHLTPMHTLTHEVESLLDLARTGKLRLTAEIITEILRSRDAVQAMVQQITVALEQGRLPETAVPVSHLIRAVKRLAAGAGEGAKADTWNRGPSVAAFAENAAGAPRPQGTPAPGGAVLQPAPTSSEARAEASRYEPAAATPATLSTPTLSAPASAAPTPANATAGTVAAPSGQGGASTVRVNTEKLDSLMDVVGELVIVQSQLQESSKGLGGDGSALGRNLAQLTRITKELQHTAMALRMVPIKPMFQRMERLVRDLSVECGKRAQFVTSGDETEIDRTVVEEITDPLVHMVRNALDHGLESPVDRLALGKPEAGTLGLSAYHEGSSLVIELTDDGRGIDPEKVLAKARRQGLVGEGVQLTREETINLIFLPGFSTAEKVTAVSGRGVGMDVVKRNIEKLRGQIQIESEVGKGSIFRIRLPLTTAIIDGLLVRVGADRFILPSTMVQMALRPVRTSLAKIQGRGEALDHRGKILPIHRLHERFGIADAVQDPTAGIVVIVENAGRSYALLVDELLNKQEVVVKNLGSFLQNLPGVAGGAILGDGNIALILDPASLCAA